MQNWRDADRNSSHFRFAGGCLRPLILKGKNFFGLFTGQKRESLEARRKRRTGGTAVAKAGDDKM
jgi:hypothetical protein